MSTSEHRSSRPAAPRVVSKVRHFGGFVLAGLTALVVDIAVLTALMAVLDWPAALARVAAIACAMPVSWLINRSVTFALTTPPSIGEFAKFAAASWLAQAVNYSTFLAVLSIVPATPPQLAVIAAAVVSMFVAYTAFRFGVFRVPATPDKTRAG